MVALESDWYLGLDGVAMPLYNGVSSPVCKSPAWLVTLRLPVVLHWDGFDLSSVLCAVRGQVR